MALIPFAEKKLIPPGSSDPRIKARIGILHVDAGNAADLWDYFAHRSGGIESHGHIRKDGHLYQYRDTAYQADANYHANDFALSFETQGFGEGQWTDAQLDTIKRVMLWAKDAHGIPLRKVTSWADERGGWGYHTLFGAPSHWTPVSKSCPGPARKVQFERVLVPWMNSNPTSTEDDMPLTDADLDKIVDRLKPLVNAAAAAEGEKTRAAIHNLVGDVVASDPSVWGDDPKNTKVKASTALARILDAVGKDSGQQ